jgi:hypothetical protein
MVAPGDHMRPKNGTQSGVIQQACIGNEFCHVGFIKSSDFGIGDIGEPFQLGRNIGEPGILISRQGMYAIDTNYFTNHRPPSVTCP